MFGIWEEKTSAKESQECFTQMEKGPKGYHKSSMGMYMFTSYVIQEHFPFQFTSFYWVKFPTFCWGKYSLFSPPPFFYLHAKFQYVHK